MKWATLGDRERRAVVLGALMLALALVIRVGVVPYREGLMEARERLEREERLLARERSLLREARGYRAAFDSLGARVLASVPRLMEGGALVSTQATLSRRLDDASRAASAQLSRVEPLPPRPSGRGLLAVPLRVEGESDYEGFLTLLADLEAGPTLFHIGALEVRGREQAMPTDLSGAAGATVVSFRFVVTGFVLEGGGPAPRGAAAGDSTRTVANPVGSVAPPSEEESAR